MAGIGKTMYAEVTGWGGGHTLHTPFQVVEERAQTLRSAAPISTIHKASQDVQRASPFMQLTLALFLIVGGYALEVIRQEQALHAGSLKKRRRRMA